MFESILCGHGTIRHVNGVLTWQEVSCHAESWKTVLHFQSILLLIFFGVCNILSSYFNLMQLGYANNAMYGNCYCNKPFFSNKVKNV